jgi:D-3-phosphoglycerate dehydrogenase
MSASRPEVCVIDPDYNVDRLSSRLGGDILLLDDTGDAAARDRVEGLITAVRPVDECVLRSFPALRVVVTCSAGYDHIDLEALGRRGVLAYNVADYCTEEVADHALAMILSLWRGLPALSASVREGGWSDLAGGPLRRIHGSTLGVVGLGRIGSALVQRARALGVEVIASDPYVPKSKFHEAGCRRASFEEVLSSSNAVSLHTRPEAGARPLIGAAELGLVSRGAVLVNVTRGSLVDLEALVDALEHQQLSGAALDVLVREPPAASDRRLLATRNLLVTPHAAWRSPAAEDRLADACATILRRTLVDYQPPPTNLV